MLKGPYLDTFTVEEALELFNRENRFNNEAYFKPWGTVKIAGIPIPFPNPQARRNLVHLHDLTHILTGYDVDWIGEGEIANWEVASGLLGKSLLAWFYVPITFTIGWLISPKKMVAAFREGCGQRSVYDLEIPRDQLMKMTLSDVRSLIKA